MYVKRLKINELTFIIRIFSSYKKRRNNARNSILSRTKATKLYASNVQLALNKRQSTQ